MQKIFLVRHGQDQDNLNKILNGRRNLPLTGLGQKQAALVGKKLKNENIELIYTSPLKRTLETASIIARMLDLPKPIKEKLLIEREFGILTGKPVKEIPKYSKKILATDRVNYFLEAKDAETFPKLYKRAKLVLQKIKNLEPNKNVLLVTHGDLGKMIRAAFHNWTWKKGLQQPYFDNTGILVLTKKMDIIE